MAEFKNFLKERQYKEAERCAVAAHKLDPDNVVTDAAVMTARLLLNGGSREMRPRAAEPQLPDETVDRLVSKKDKTMAQLLSRYDEACRLGRLAEAMKLARQALALDPTCFRKPGPDPSP